jgi:hypothetical protein
MVQILHSKIVTNCEILVSAFVSRILWCGRDTDYLVQTPEFDIHENLIKCGTIQFLHLLDKMSQTLI